MRTFAPIIAILWTLCACQRTTSDTHAAPDSLTQVIRVPSIVKPNVDTVRVVTPEKLRLTAEYCLDNYGLKGYRLDTPRMVVVHYTAIGDLDATLNLFRQDYINSSRTDIKGVSNLNVGIHYVVARDGRIFHLTPDSIVARHVIGLNHVALGIENVAKDSSELTNEQLESNARLIAYLAHRYPTIEFVLGHHEYNDSNLEHFRWYLELNEKYKPHGKIDPGPAFMTKLRNRIGADFKR